MNEHEAAATVRPSGNAIVARVETIDDAYRERLSMTAGEWMVIQQRQIATGSCSWMGVAALKNPLDAWIYQEILWEIKPEIVVEFGTAKGGSALFLCHMFDAIGDGLVLTVDIDHSHLKKRHPRMVPITGDTMDPKVEEIVRGWCEGKRTLIIHDADHRHMQVLTDLRKYADLVSVGSYFIVEDGMVDLFAPPIGWSRKGPLHATREFLAEDDRFEVDRTRERFVMTYNPQGFLRRVK